MGGHIVQSGGGAFLCDDHRCHAEVTKDMRAGTGENVTRCRGLLSTGQWCPAHGCRHEGCEEACMDDGFLCPRHARPSVSAINSPPPSSPRQSLPLPAADADRSSLLDEAAAADRDNWEGNEAAVGRCRLAQRFKAPGMYEGVTIQPFLASNVINCLRVFACRSYLWSRCGAAVEPMSILCL